MTNPPGITAHNLSIDPTESLHCESHDLVKQVTLLFKLGVKHRHSFCTQYCLRPARRDSSDLTTDHMLLSCYARTSTAPVRLVRDDPGYSEVDPSQSPKCLGAHPPSRVDVACRPVHVPD
jgi:hypothetical protein